MRVNSISQTKQSFKSLIVTKDADKYLNKLSVQDLLEVIKASKVMQDYMYTDLYINSKGAQVYNLIDDEIYGYNPPEKLFMNTSGKNPNGDGYLYALVPNDKKGNKQLILLHTENDEDITKKYNKLSNSKGIERTIEFTKALEQTLAHRVNTEA